MNNHRILFKNHNGTIGSWEGWTDGANVHTMSYKKVGGNPVSHVYMAKAKNVGRANMTTPDEQALLELDSKTRLKLDKGYVLKVEEAEVPATNSLGLPKPMLAQPFDKVKPEKICWTTSVVQPKLDGHRALYKDGVLYSRQGKVLEHLDHIITAIKDSGLGDFHLDGEIYLHGFSLQELSRKIKKMSTETLTLEYHIYDQVADLPFMVRIGELAEAKMNQDWDNVLQPVDTVPIYSMDEMFLWHEHYRRNGYEGTMLRYGTDPYQTDKRSSSLLKVKEFHDAEFEVIDWEAGKPYVKGNEEFQVPVWICATKGGQTFNVTAQGTMYEKDNQYRYADDYIGKQLTVKYHYLSKDGIPQLPVALRWREDV